MKKMLPTQKTFLVAADHRVDSIPRRTMTRHLRRHFARRIEIDSWKEAAQKSAAALSSLFNLIGLAADKEHSELELKSMQALRKRRTLTA